MAQQGCFGVSAVATSVVVVVVVATGAAGARRRLDTLVFSFSVGVAVAVAVAATLLSVVGTDFLDADLACVGVNAGTGSFARFPRTAAAVRNNFTGFLALPNVPGSVPVAPTAAGSLTTRWNTGDVSTSIMPRQPFGSSRLPKWRSWICSAAAGRSTCSVPATIVLHSSNTYSRKSPILNSLASSAAYP